MGTINYYTSDYITIASVCPLYPDDYREDAEEQARDTGEDVDTLIEQWIALEHESAWADAQEAAAKTKRNSFWKLEARPGYYEGSQVIIKNELPTSLTNAERKTALAEVDELEKALVYLAENSTFVETWPGWCQKRFTPAETLDAIARAAEEMREAVRAVPAWVPEGGAV